MSPGSPREPKKLGVLGVLAVDTQEDTQGLRELSVSVVNREELGELGGSSRAASY